MVEMSREFGQLINKQGCGLFWGKASGCLFFLYLLVILPYYDGGCRIPKANPSFPVTSPIVFLKNSP
jgi:hypothetical protein